MGRYCKPVVKPHKVVHHVKAPKRHAKGSYSKSSRSYSRSCN